MSDTTTNKYSHSKNTNLDATVVKNIKTGTVRSVKGSPEKGCKRYVVREKSTGGNTFTVDIPHKEAKNIERKETYDFNVHEKRNNRIGSGGREKKTTHRIYACDEEPTVYDGSKKATFKDFSGSGRLNGGKRTKFT